MSDIKNEIGAEVSGAKARLDFGIARRLLEAARTRVPGEIDWKTDSDAVWIVQQLALCTYKDVELPTGERYAKALDVLESIGLRHPENRDAETLALGGAICKRMWEADGQIEHLYEAVLFYQAAHCHPSPDNPGHGGVNAAFLLDVLAARAAQIARRSQGDRSEAATRQEQARQLRREVVDRLAASLAANPVEAQDYWCAVTYGEALFGLGDYEAAGEWLANAASAGDIPEWQREATFRQLATLARHQSIAEPLESAAAKADDRRRAAAMGRFLGEAAERAAGCYRGRVGLALSGGGFRASLFHLGVMARLAEADALRSVEVLSTVSGGSILGAHYYLEVKKLLEAKPDGQVTREDYIDIVRRLQEQFLAGVQTNIRMRMLGDLGTSLKMLFKKGHGSSHRLGELYESELYARVQDGHAPGAPRTMPGLLVSPAGEPRDFKPNFSNWRRRAKVPILLLNATSLNSGHNWRFNARSMGEPPGTQGRGGAVNQRYRRVNYENAPNPELQNYRMGYAVASSACVPGLFDPLAIEGLYPDRTVRLVDGGVHDNQGTAGLLDENCTLVLCSDASGQMADAVDPADDPAGVLMRASSVLQARVREAQYESLSSRVDSHALEGLLFIHAKQELEQPPLNWSGADEPVPYVGDSGNTTSYGIDRNLQARIAGIRTDLDSFTEVEAYALMASGYRIASRQLEKLQARHEKDGSIGSFGDFTVDAPGEDWPFRPIEPLLALPEGADPRRDDLELQLSIGGLGFLKAWKLVPELRRLALIGGILLLALLAGLIYAGWNQTAVSLTWGAIAIVLLGLAIGVFAPAFRWLFPKDQARSFFIKFAIAILGYVAAKIHLGTVDRLFLARGKLDRLLNLK